MSTSDQDLTPQRDALLAAGIAPERIFEDKASGARKARPGLDALLEVAQPGDVIMVWKIDRLGRSVAHLARLIADLGERGIDLVTLDDHIDTRTSTGRFTFHLMAAVSELELELNRSRTSAALEARRRSGKPLGRPSQVTRWQYEAIKAEALRGQSDEQIAKEVRLTRSVVGRVRRDEIASIRHYALDTTPVDLPMSFEAGRGRRRAVRKPRPGAQPMPKGAAQAPEGREG